MRMTFGLRAPCLALFLISIATAAFGQIGISVSFGPPELPVYEQPVNNGDGSIWTPGYWAWDGEDYYWVPGTWVMPPEVGYLWTPAYWGWGDSGYLFHEGYWGPHVGFYGGVNYGFGYSGHGYDGGRWDNGHFFYNRSVNNVDVNVIHNVYNTNVAVNQSRVSYNGGRGGINERATSQEEGFSRERHVAPVAQQTQHMNAARGNRDSHAAVNHGSPAVTATPRPQASAGRGGNAAPAMVHAKELPALARPTAPNTGNPKLDQRYQQQQQKLYNTQNQERARTQQQQEKEHQTLTRQNAPPARQQQVEQQHQQQTQQMQQRHVQQQQQMQQRQQPQAHPGPGAGRGK